ncbi:MAG: fibronectin type III domain-containing protein, partial [Methylococcaceae bacterium]
MAGCEATSATIKVTYSGVVEGMSYLKYRHGHWTELTADNANLQLVGNTATFVIEDNGPFDADPAVGIISDPGGPGYASLPPMPGVVEAPSATAGDAEATVSWTAPLSGGPAVRYTVTSTPDAKTCTVLAPETRCKVTGLTNDRAYTFNIVAENAAGKGSVSADTRAVTPRYAGTSGLCGTAQGQATLMPPVAGLCESGTASAVTTEKGVHRWICAPVGSALPSSCSAPGLSARGAIGTVSFELQPGSGCAIRKTALGSVPFGVPKKVSLPYGLVDFSLAQCTAEYADLRMTFSGSVEGLSLWKWIHQTWTRIPGVDVSGHTVRFRVKDNGPYDADPERGVIVDPAAVGTSSGKKDQPTLTVKSGKSRIKSGRAVLVKTRGGKGRGKVNYHVKASGGTSCRVLRNGALTLLKTSGTRDGTCTVWATKAADRKYNAAVSSPVTIGVICPKP